MTVMSTLLEALEVRPGARNFAGVAVVTMRIVGMVTMRIVGMVTMRVVTMVTMPEPLPCLFFSLDVHHVFHGGVVERIARLGDVRFKKFCDRIIQMTRLQFGTG